MDMLQIDRLTALGHVDRMGIFRLLMRRYPEDVPAGEIAQALELKQNTASVHLSALTRAGLLHQQRAGRNILYRVQMEGVDDLVGYLFQDCCRSRPDLCFDAQGTAAKSRPTPRKFNALFICTGNSARSIFAETVLRSLAGSRFNVYSAGTDPASNLSAIAVDLLRSKGYDTTNLRSKHVSELQAEDAPQMDFVFTVCDSAANEDCPAWPGQPISAHWGVPDPIKATGSSAEKRLAYQQAYGILKNRITLFAALDTDTLDRASLQTRVDDIAKQGEPA